MMFSFTLIKEPCPAWLSFFLHCWQSTYHLSLHRITHTSTDFAGWASTMQFGKESSVSPFPNLVLPSACPWQHCEHCDTPLISLVANRGRAHGGLNLAAEEMKYIHLLCCCKQMKKAKTNSDTACWTLLKHLRHSSRLGLLPWDPNLQRWLSLSLSPPFSFYYKLCQLSIQTFPKKDILNLEIWKIESYLRDHLVHWFSSCSEKLRISQIHLELLTQPPRRECSPIPSTGAPLLWSVLHIKVPYKISFLRGIL